MRVYRNSRRRGGPIIINDPNISCLLHQKQRTFLSINIEPEDYKYALIKGASGLTNEIFHTLFFNVMEEFDVTSNHYLFYFRIIAAEVNSSNECIAFRISPLTVYYGNSIESEMNNLYFATIRQDQHIYNLSSENRMYIIIACRQTINLLPKDPIILRYNVDQNCLEINGITQQKNATNIDVVFKGTNPYATSIGEPIIHDTSPFLIIILGKIQHITHESERILVQWLKSISLTGIMYNLLGTENPPTQGSIPSHPGHSIFYRVK